MKYVASVTLGLLVACCFGLSYLDAGSRTRIVTHHAAYAVDCDTSAVCSQPVLVATCSGPERVVTKTKTLALTCDCDIVKVKTRTVETADRTAIVWKVK